MKARTIILVCIIIVLLAVVIFLVINSTTATPKADPVTAQCSYYCQTSQQSAFCNVGIKLNTGAYATCDQLSSDSQYSAYGVQACSAFSCAASSPAGSSATPGDQTCVTGLGGTWTTPASDGGCPQSGIKIVRQVQSSDTAPVAGQICCV